MKYVGTLWWLCLLALGGLLGCGPSDNEVVTAPKMACEDEEDNDGDGLIDFPDDPDCTHPADESEFPAPAACSDGIDNDEDGLVDFPEDPECLHPEDDDGDGQTDYPADPECSSATDSSEGS